MWCFVHFFSKVAHFIYFDFNVVRRVDEYPHTKQIFG